jgi:hypothetical protein
MPADRGIVFLLYVRPGVELPAPRCRLQRAELLTGRRAVPRIRERPQDFEVDEMPLCEVKRLTARWLVAALLLLGATPLAAHDFTITDTYLLLENDGTFQVEMTCDLDALLLGVGPGHPPEELVARIASLDEPVLEERRARLVDYFERRVRVRFDGEPAPFVVTFPDRVELAGAVPGPPTYLGVSARLTGVVPADAESVTFFASRTFRAVHIALLRQSGGPAQRRLLGVGEESPPFPVQAPEGGDEDGEGVGRGDGWRYLSLGFTHILPYGLDHVLFVLGLFLLGAGFRSLLWQVSAFTVAHTLTLALSVLGVAALPARVVEPAIALSIAYVALENVWRREVGPWRLAVVVAFGLLHGLGFAGALREIGLPQDDLLTALVAFNVGVELGQIAALALAFAVLGWWRERPWYRRRIAVPASLALGACGLALVAQRLLAG